MTDITDPITQDGRISGPLQRKFINEVNQNYLEDLHPDVQLIPEAKRQKTNSMANHNIQDTRNNFPGIPTNNRFEAFSTEAFKNFADAAGQTSTNTNAKTTGPNKTNNPGTSTSTPTITARPPPIYIRIAEKEIINFSKELEAEIGKNFYLKYLGDQIRLHFSENKYFLSAKIAFQNAGLKFHTFALPNEKPLTVILKGLPQIETELIATELQQANITPLIVASFRTSPRNSLYKITFPPGTKMSQIKSIGFIYHCRIYWERFLKTKNYTQCYRCQAFGHASANCFKVPKCVKCGLEHLTKDCTKTPDLPAKCANCNGSHTANFSQCPSLLTYINRKSTPRSTRSPKGHQITHIRNDPPRQNAVLVGNRSFSEVVKGQAPPQNSNEFQEYLDPSGSNDFLKEAILFIKKAIPIVNSIRPKLATCTSMFDKLEIIFEAAQQLFT